MPLTILSDSDVRTLLLQLTKEDILDLQQSLADALHYYSTSTEDDSNGCSSSYQPLRTSLKRSDGQTTLFMPASSNDGLGVKIVTLLTGDNENKGSKSEDGLSVTSSLGSLSLSQQSSGTGGSPTIANETISSAQSTTPKGSLSLFDKNGNPRALLNAEEITAFRTALASTMLFKKRVNVHDVVVFGAGKQAYWHIRLALLLRGTDIHHLSIINRDFERVHHLLEKLYNPHETPVGFDPDPAHVPAHRQATPHDLSRPKIVILTPSHGEYTRLLKSTIRASSVIFFTTPSLTPLFPPAILTNPEGRKKGRYLAAIGSYKPHMVEIHPDILRQNVAPEHGHRHFHKHAQQGGAVVVDSVEACLKEAGEVIQAGLGPEQVVEIGELVMLKRDAERRRRDCLASRSAEGLDEGGVELGECEKTKKRMRGRGSGSGKEDHDGEDKAHKSLMEWLTKGNVIYKSVGLGLMDVVVGNDLVRLADERGIGVKIENF
ncbi:NAD(P)-binding protein [Clathrospora elynae]|uniref:NAD(P)-binding protein n=1 Tax=Clathrospora elynae TaxID=706981 RepID=A0A6A5SZK5_9PLEO|nr:NAD(P)-binding protein [Clathrospora elynae]